MRLLRRQHPRPQAGLPIPLPLCLATWAAHRQGQPRRVLPSAPPTSAPAVPNTNPLPNPWAPPSCFWRTYSKCALHPMLLAVIS